MGERLVGWLVENMKLGINTEYIMSNINVNIHDPVPCEEIQESPQACGTKMI